MRITVKKSSLRLLVVLMCYISTILALIYSSTTARYGMYAFVIGVAVLESITENKSLHIWRNYQYVVILAIVVFLMTVFTGIFGGGIQAGSLIQPIFLLSCYKIGFDVVMKYGEYGCVKVLKGWSYVIAFAAIACVPEWLTQRSLFFPDYGNSWSTFRTPSIYGHPIRLGASLTIGLAIYIYIYHNTALKYMLLGVSLFGIYVCMSRSSWIACIGTIVLLSFAVYRKRITRRKFLVGAAVILAFALFLLSKPGSEIIAQILIRFGEATSDNISRTQRLGAITYILNDEFNNLNLFTFLFGHGEDAAARLMLRTTINIENFSTTDNEYLLILYNYGIIILLLIIKGVFMCIKRFAFDYDGEGSVEKCLLFICISSAICSFFFELTENKSCAFLLMCCIGMLMALKKQKDSPKQLIRIKI